MLLLGYDIGSSAIKAALLDAETGRTVAMTRSPSDTELAMDAPQPGWAEQPPDRWWDHVIAATQQLHEAADWDPADVQGIGLSYQMHGLVLVDDDLEALRPSIIWCDSRAVDIGQEAFEALGAEWCLSHLLNSPGNFTASKLAWVKRNEPDRFARVHKAMLPGDYIALRLTGRACTTPSGLSEGTLWDVQRGGLATDVLDVFEIPPELFPEVVSTFSEQGALTPGAADALGLRAGTPVAYRAGDQPNNALSLAALEPGELAATAGTSGVVYGVGDTATYDPEQRVNTFLHVNHTPDRPRYGTLLCVNGTGILNRWLHDALSGPNGALSYAAMNETAAQAPVGADGLVVLPYGNGAERTLGNADPGASLHGLNFNVHGRAHLLRAAQEGIVFALHHGLDAMRDMDLRIDTVRAGHANMFLSPIFTEAFATVTGATVELVETDGAVGAARGAGLGTGVFAGPDEAFAGLTVIDTVDPDPNLTSDYAAAYARWSDVLTHQLNTTS